MKKILTAILLVATPLVFFGHIQAQASDCTAKVGKWEVEYLDGKKTIWYLKEVEPTVFVYSCVLEGTASGEAYTGNFSIVQIVFDGNFYYTEADPITKDSPTTMLIFAEDGLSFTAADNGAYPIKSGIMIGRGGSDEEECPVSAVLGHDDPRLETLRVFRDSILMKSVAGRLFVKMYYSNSAKMKYFIEQNPSLKAAIRRVLESFCTMIELFNAKP